MPLGDDEDSSYSYQPTAAIPSLHLCHPEARGRITRRCLSALSHLMVCRARSTNTRGPERSQLPKPARNKKRNWHFISMHPLRTWPLHPTTTLKRSFQITQLQITQISIFPAFPGSSARRQATSLQHRPALLSSGWYLLQLPPTHTAASACILIISLASHVLLHLNRPSHIISNFEN